MNLLSRRSTILSLFAGVVGMTAIATNTPAKSANRLVNQGSVMDYLSIINAVNGTAIFADLRDWKRCRQSFTNEVEFDYTSLMGGKPIVISADKQMQQWETFFKNTFKSTQHMIGSHVVTVNGNTATCMSNFQAHHTYLDAQKGTWILSGVYHHELVRSDDSWKISKMRMTWTWEDGTRPS